MNRLNRQDIAPLLVLAALAVVAVIIFYPKGEAYGQLDSFARCLSSKGAVMYGADWCSHCQNEKKAFGDSFRFVNYVECPAEPKRCAEAGINGYPTWTFPASLAGSTSSLQAGLGQAGKKLEGEQGIDKLSKESGCPLPTNNQ